MAAPTTVLTILKDFTYRGVAGEEWSNTYALSGATPADSTAWRSLFDAVVLEEKKVYIPAVRVIGGYGYSRIPVKGDAAVWTLDLRPSSSTVAGTLAVASNPIMSGDQAAWVRWSMDRFSTKGKRIYLRKYFHGGILDGTAADVLHSTYKTALGNFGTFMRGGTINGTRSLVDKTGLVPIASTNATWSTTRTLKRRPKRPPP